MSLSFEINPRFDWVPEYFICLAVIFVLFNFVIISAVNGRSTRQKQKKDEDRRLLRTRSPSRFGPDALDERREADTFFGKLCYDASQKATSCERARFGAMKYMIVPFQLLAEFITIFFMLQLWREDRDHKYTYDPSAENSGSTDEKYINDFAAPSAWYHYVPIFIIGYLFTTAGIVLNQTLNLKEAFHQLIGVRGVVLMYRQAFENEYSQFMVDVATLQALMFSILNLLFVTTYAFEAFQGASQGSWYCIIYFSIFISAINISRAMNYNDKFGLIHDTCFANTMLIAFRCAEIYLRICVLAVFAAYFNKSVTFLVIFVFMGCYFLTMLNRAEFFRKENSGAQSQHKCRSLCRIWYDAVSNYFFLDIRCCKSSFAFYSNCCQFLEMALMVGILMHKNSHPYKVFDKQHRDVNFRLFFLLRIGMGLLLVFLTGLYLVCTGNYSIDQYDKCTNANVTVLLNQVADGKSYAMDALKTMILRKEIFQLRDEEARIIFQHWGGKGIKEKWESGEFTMGEIIRLRYPLEEVSKKIPWNHMKDSAFNKLVQSITESRASSKGNVFDANCDDEINDDCKSDEVCCSCFSKKVKKVQKGESSKPSLDEQAPDEAKEKKRGPETPTVELTTIPLQQPDQDDEEKKKMLRLLDLEAEGEFVQDADDDKYIPLQLHQQYNCLEKDKISNYYYTFVSEILKSKFKEEDLEELKHKYKQDEKMNTLVEELMRDPLSPEVPIFHDINIEKLLRTLLLEYNIIIFMWRIKPQELFSNQDIEEIQQYNPEKSKEFPFFDLVMDTCLCQDDQASWEASLEKNVFENITEADYEVFHVLEKYKTLPDTSGDHDGSDPGFYVYRDEREAQERTCPDVNVVEGLTEKDFQYLAHHLNDTNQTCQEVPEKKDEDQSHKFCASCVRPEDGRPEGASSCESCVTCFTKCYSQLDNVGVKAFKKDDFVMIQVPDNYRFQQNLSEVVKDQLDDLRKAQQKKDIFKLKERAKRAETDPYLMKLFGDSREADGKLYFTKIREETIVEILFEDDDDAKKNRIDAEGRIVFFELLNEDESSANEDQKIINISEDNYVRLDYKSIQYLTAENDNVDQKAFGSSGLNVPDNLKRLKEKNPDIIRKLDIEDIPSRKVHKPDNMQERDWFQFGKDYRIRVYTSTAKFAGVRGSSAWKIEHNDHTHLIPESWLRRPWNKEDNMMKVELEWQTKLKFPKSETETESKFAKFNIGIDIDGEGKVTHVYQRVYDVAERIRNHDLEELKKKIDNKNESIEDLQARIDISQPDPDAVSTDFKEKDHQSTIYNLQQAMDKTASAHGMDEKASVPSMDEKASVPIMDKKASVISITPSLPDVKLSMNKNTSVVSLASTASLVSAVSPLDALQKDMEQLEQELQQLRDIKKEMEDFTKQYPKDNEKHDELTEGFKHNVEVGWRIVAIKQKDSTIKFMHAQENSVELTTSLEQNVPMNFDGDEKMIKQIWAGEQPDLLDINKEFFIVFYKCDLGFEIDMYDWNLTKVNEKFNGVLEEGWSLQYMHLLGDIQPNRKGVNSQKKFLHKLRSDNDLEPINKAKRREVTSFADQEDIVNYLEGPEGANFCDYKFVEAYFLAPEKPSVCDKVKGWIGDLVFWLLCCTPAAYCSYKWFCCRGGYKVTAQNIVWGKTPDGKRFLVEDGDILLISFASPGWLSLSQGGQWGHCGLIWRYKEKMVNLMPERFKNQLIAWKRRGFIKENTPLVFEMCNHIREGDTNNFQIHLSHLANWHMRKETSNYFGPMLGIRKYKGKRDLLFYKAFLEVMHKHHHKEYESVPFEFVCSGMCCYATTEEKKQLEQLFCSELVAVFHKELCDEHHNRLIASYAFPSEFQPSDYGKIKGAIPFGFVCCCCLSYYIFGCCDARQTAYYPINKYLGALMICDISSIKKLEDDINADLGKRRLQEKFRDTGKTILNFDKVDHRKLIRGPTGRGGIFAAPSKLVHSHTQADLFQLKWDQAVKMSRLKAVKTTQRGCGALAVEFTWWIFYIVTFPFGILIRYNYVLHVDDDVEESESKWDKTKKQEMTEQMRQYYVMITGSFYLVVWFIIFRAIYGMKFRLPELIYGSYFFGVILVGSEGSFFTKDNHKALYVTIYRTGFRFYGVKIRNLPSENLNISEILSPVKIPFMTVFMLSVSFVVGLIVNSLGFDADSGKIDLRLHEDPLIFIGAICGLVALVYKVGQFIIQSAVGEYPQILLQLQPRNPYKRHEIENEAAEFISAKEKNSEGRRLLQLEGNDPLERDELSLKINNKIQAIEKQNKHWQEELEQTQNALKNREFWTKNKHLDFLRPILQRERVRLLDDIHNNAKKEETISAMQKECGDSESRFLQLKELTYPYGQSIQKANICCIVRLKEVSKSHDYLKLKVYDRSWGSTGEEGEDIRVNFIGEDHEIEAIYEHFENIQNSFDPVVIFEKAQIRNVAKDQKLKIDAIRIIYGDKIYGRNELDDIWVDELEMYAMGNKIDREHHSENVRESSPVT